MGRRRFGVSIEESLASRLDELASLLGKDRSRLVEEAVRAFLDDLEHMAGSHECRGLIVALCGEAGRVPVDEYRRIVSSHMHVHLKDECVELLLVEGDSGAIAGLYGRLLEEGCRARYVPLH